MPGYTLQFLITIPLGKISPFFSGNGNISRNSFFSSSLKVSMLFSFCCILCNCLYFKFSEPLALRREPHNFFQEPNFVQCIENNRSGTLCICYMYLIPEPHWSASSCITATSRIVLPVFLPPKLPLVSPYFLQQC